MSSPRFTGRVYQIAAVAPPGSLWHRPSGVPFHRRRVMAKKTAKKQAEKQPEPKSDVIDPKRVHELFSIPGPYEPKEVPIPTKNYVTFWDAGMSINEMRRRKKELFSFPAWLDGQQFAKDSDSWKWRQICLIPFGLNEPFD